MKRTTLLFAVLGFLSYQSHAQIAKGRIQIGGSIGANHSETAPNQFQDKTKITGVSISPSLGWFYKPNKLAGVFLDFGYSELDNGYSNTINRGYGGGVYFRQYQPVINKLYLFLHESAAYDYTSGSVSYTQAGVSKQNTHSYSIGAALQAGMAYDISKKLQLEISLNRLVNAYYQNGEGTKGYGISTSLEKDVFSNIGFGFRYYLK